ALFIGSARLNRTKGTAEPTESMICRDDQGERLAGRVAQGCGSKLWLKEAGDVHARWPGESHAPNRRRHRRVAPVRVLAPRVRHRGCDATAAPARSGAGPNRAPGAVGPRT